MHIAENFYNHQRHDAVIMRSAPTDFIALLQLVFVCNVDGKPFAVALVQGLDAPTGPV